MQQCVHAGGWSGRAILHVRIVFLLSCPRADLKGEGTRLVGGSSWAVQSALPSASVWWVLLRTSPRPGERSKRSSTPPMPLLSSLIPLPGTNTPIPFILPPLQHRHPLRCCALLCSADTLAPSIRQHRTPRRAVKGCCYLLLLESPQLFHWPGLAIPNRTPRPVTSFTSTAQCLSW